MNLLVKNNYIYFDTESFPCAVGAKGLTKNKMEGDMCTPVGEFEISKIYYRSDKLKHLNFQISSKIINKNDGWCDDPKSKLYNQYIQFPFSGSAEKLFREDDLYDIICILNYNTDPIIPGRGSAIFLHVSKPNFEGTEGCIAISRENLIYLSQKINEKTKIIIDF